MVPFVHLVIVLHEEACPSALVPGKDGGHVVSLACSHLLG